MKNGTLFLLSGPSAVGKTTLARSLIEEIGKELMVKMLVTYTTKEPRPSDIPGKDYHFLDQEDFLKLKEEGFFIETAFVYGNWYGVGRMLLSDLQSGVSYIAVVDTHGAKTLASLYSKHIGIWLDAPSVEVLEKRMLERARDKPADILRRLALAENERTRAHADPVYSYYVVNSDLIETLVELNAILRREMLQEKS